ncbi:MAG: cysteine--tRNA ligase [Chloroflexi bacterium]|nr:cysteine--tRNA ligase [Chloroflexota bacterium]MBU1749087.1 cysteine--tRNA ligase [Chloroflexota bacterium]
MTLQVYNYLTRRKEEFVPQHPGLVSLYVCGPTVYDHAHLGHALGYVSYDVIVRYLRYLGYRVMYVQNITDVGHILDSGEDRILKGAQRERVEPMELVETYTRSYFDDMDGLGVGRPSISPRASGHIPEQIEIVKALLAQGHAYEVDGSVYFDVASWPAYGELSGRKVDDLLEGARVQVRDEKRSPVDFALWKRAEPEHILRWPSPWGWGYPGWHVECSAMAKRYLGETIDIHGGGIENIFPHNEDEKVQSEAANGVPFARYWILWGTLNVEGVKMSKSLGNFVTIKDALARYRPEALRFFILTSHYRATVNYTDDSLTAADKGLQRLLDAVAAVRRAIPRAPDADAPADPAVLDSLADYKAQFLASMDNDFDTGGAIGVLFNMARESNTLLHGADPASRATLEAVDALYRELGADILGIIPETLDQERSLGLEEPLIDLLVRTRQDLRAAKQWALADGLRDQLTELGITLRDGPDGTTWQADR